MTELDIFMQKYIHLVYTRCECDKNVLTDLYQELLKDSVKPTCTYKFIRGTNKGTFCGGDIFENNLCKKHARQQATRDKIQDGIANAEKSRDDGIANVGNLKPIIVHFDSKLNENMMHVNKSPIEIKKEYEKIINPKQYMTTTIKKHRILPPSLRPMLKIGDNVLYNDGKKTCNAIVKKIIKDMAILDNISNASNNDTRSFAAPTRCIFLAK